MIDNQILELFTKFYNKTESSEERDKLFMWVLDDENNTHFEDLLKSFYDIELNISNESEKKLSFNPKENENVRIKRVISLIAAAIILVVGVVFLFYFQKSTMLSRKIVTNMMYDIPAGGNRATLTLANGEKINLDSVSPGYSLNEQGMLVRKSDDGLLTYTMPKEFDNINSYNTLSTPIGGFFKVILSDGTKVWLNALSSIKFKPSFSSNERRVELTGEAYFEVAKDLKRPFVVTVNENEIKVIGTHFNINSYATNLDTYTTVLEGIVSVQKNKNIKKVIAGEILNTDKSGHMILSRPNNISQRIAWTNGFFCTESISLTNLMEEVSRWYGLDIQYAKSTQAEFVAKLPKNLSLRELMLLLEMTDKVKFELVNNTLNISPM